MMSARRLAFAALLLFILWCSVQLYSATSVDLMTTAQAIASPSFVRTYVLLLVAITVAAIVRSELSLTQERADALRIIRILGSSEKPDARLRLLNRLTDARIHTNEICRAEVLSLEERSAATRTHILPATAAFLGMVSVTPFSRYGAEGLRPSKNVLLGELRRTLPRLTSLGDLLVRLGLLGTFAGLIAALAIASANVSVAHGSAEAQNAHMQEFIQQLLASAAAKFWISAVAMACALVVRLWQNRLDWKTSRIADDVGLAFDDALGMSPVAEAWFLPQEAGPDAISQQIREIADQIKKSADNWKLTIDIGGNPSRSSPRVALTTSNGIDRD